jgi:hypothetical protein
MADAEEMESVYKPTELPEGELDDLAKLTNLSADTLLHEVKVRYDADVIYVSLIRPSRPPSDFLSLVLLLTFLDGRSSFVVVVSAYPSLLSLLFSFLSVLLPSRTVYGFYFTRGLMGTESFR